MPILPGINRPWEIYLVQHTHVDIGYTEPQQIIIRKHAEYIATALDYCAATDHLPEGERFVWTCEVSWTVEAFLERYPKRADEFFQRVKEGRIEIGGIYLQLTDLFGEELLKSALDYAPSLAREHGFEVVTALNDDVNGWSWGLAKMLSERGIRYFDTAINETRSLPVRPRPHPFYWTSSEGSRVLMWHGGHYAEGNTLRLEEPGAEDYVREYLAKLETSGYPHSAVEVRVQGEYTDNAPPNIRLCEAVREWNAKWEYPKLRLGTPRTWFEHIENHWPEPIKELKAGWPDWWADGNGSALFEASLVRKAQADMSTVEAAAEVGGKIDQERLNAARRAAMFFAEHTWGAWCSTDDPDSLESRAQWNTKAGYAYTAAIEASDLVKSTLTSCAPARTAEHEIAVFNPLPWDRTDVVEMVVPDHLIGGDPLKQVLDSSEDEDRPEVHLTDLNTGRKIAVDRTPVLSDSMRRAGQLIRFVAHDVPALSWRSYSIGFGEGEAGDQASVDRLTATSPHFRAVVSAETGGLTSVTHMASGRELVAGGEYDLNQYIYEIIDSPEGRQALCDWTSVRRDASFSRFTPPAQIRAALRPPLGAYFAVESGGDNVPCIKSEILLYDDIQRIDILSTMVKQPVDRPESVYVAFPVRSSRPMVYLDIPGAVMRPGLDQVMGTATDWHSIQHYFAVEDLDWTTVIASPDVPLVQVNGINTGKWQEELPPHNGTVMSWVMNNYWFTNFPAAQGGTTRFRYSIGGYEGTFDPERSRRFALEVRQPLVGVLV